MPSNKKLFLIHYHPLEQYPPAMNMIDFFSNKNEFKLKVFSTKPALFRNLQLYSPNGSACVDILRPISQHKNKYKRYFGYLVFHLVCLFRIIVFRPNTIMYIDSLSSWPALFYKKMINKKVKMIVHYHEYTTPEDYRNIMLLNFKMHEMEKKMYPTFQWVSHTNQERMKFFRNDILMQDVKYDHLFHIMPNYPNPNWISNENNKPEIEGGKIKLVYVGSLGMKNMYLKELFEWVDSKNGKYSLDIYAHNIEDETRLILNDLKHKDIHFLGGCDYHQLSSILPLYDIGVVIYKPFSTNTIHAVSNKVFEYLAFGLDVWFSSDMTHTVEYIRSDCYPKIIPINYNNLADFDDDSAINREGLSFVPSPYHYEGIYQELLIQILRN
jgi:hypothetical protein